MNFSRKTRNCIAHGRDTATYRIRILNQIVETSDIPIGINKCTFETVAEINQCGQLMRIVQPPKINWINYLLKDEMISCNFFKPISYSFKIRKIKPSKLEILALDFPRVGLLNPKMQKNQIESN